MSAKAKTTGRFVCPMTGVPSDCSECAAPFPHVREELVQKGQKIPSCETHNLKLVEQKHPL